jgi:hypothetical protein
MSVAGPGPGVAHHVLRLREARHGEAVLRLLVLDGVAAAELRARLLDLGLSAGEDLAQYPHVQRSWEGYEVQRRQGLAAHRVHVREGVGRGDLAEPEGIVHDRRKEVGRLQEQAAAERHVPGAVPGLHAAHETLQRFGREPLQCLLQVPWANLDAQPAFFECFVNLVRLRSSIRREYIAGRERRAS